MAIDSSSNSASSRPAEPPHGGKTTEPSMRQAAHEAVSAPSNMKELAAGGGLEVPESGGRAPAEEHLPETDASAMIPGAREADTLTHREPGAIGGQFNGSDIPATHTSLLDTADAVEAYREGGLSRKAAERKVRGDDGHKR
jgi:hypothetical protein